MHDRRPATTPDLDDELELAPAFDLRDLARVHPRLLLAAALVSLLMLPVGAILAQVGVWVLEISGGAADDTSAVVGIAGYAVADFWGGGIVTSLTRARALQVAVAWAIVRLGVLLVVALVAGFSPLLAVQLVVAVPVAYVGARVARKQAALRRQIERERVVQAERDERRAVGVRDAADALS